MNIEQIETKFLKDSKEKDGTENMHALEKLEHASLLSIRLKKAGITPDMLEKLASGEAKVMEWVEYKEQKELDEICIITAFHEDEGSRDFCISSCYSKDKEISECDKHVMTFNGFSFIPTPKGDE